MIGAIRSETLKSLRGRYFAFFSIAVLISVALSIVTDSLAAQIAVTSTTPRLEAAGGLGTPLGLPAIPIWIVVIAPIFAWGSEFRNGHYLTSLSTVPRPLVLCVAKSVVWVIWCVLVIAVCTAASLLTILVRAAASPAALYDATILAVFIDNMLLTAVLSTIALAAAFVFRSSTATAAGLLLWAWAVEPFVELVFTYVPSFSSLTDFVSYLPIRAISQIQAGDGLGSAIVTFQLSHREALVEGLVIFVACNVVTTILAWRRDPA